MFNIAIIGAGQLGSRHLQGLARLDLDCRYYVVDPSAQSLQIAKNRVEELGNPGINDRIEYHASHGELPDVVDYVVVATAADVRLRVLQELLKARTVRNLLLEKVLFQRVEDYQLATELLGDLSTRVWVNCPRRTFPIYQTVRTFFENRTLLQFQVNGGNWGLGCNAIHFLDLLGFLNGHVPSNLSVAALDKTIWPSKRSNFYEFTGTLRGECGPTSFDITSIHQSSMRLMLTVRAEDRSCFIDEVAGQAFFYDQTANCAWTPKSFQNPFVSEQSTAIAREVLVNASSGLTSFDESVSYHLPLIKALAAHAENISGFPHNLCPIT